VQSVRREARVSTVVIGVDPGTRKMGVGVIRVTSFKPWPVPDKLEFVLAETLVAKATDSPAERLLTLYGDLCALCNEFPDHGTTYLCGIEEGFGGGFATDLVLAEVRGVARAVLALTFGQGSIRGYGNSTVKKIGAGHGKATKKDVQLAVMRTLQMSKKPQADAADALAIAITRARDKE
jgi:crossover junction endodeoxyribonuclease RuvC